VERESLLRVQAEEYDSFSQIDPSQSGKSVVVPIHIYELFKGIAMQRINFENKETLLASDLIVDY